MLIAKKDSNYVKNNITLSGMYLVVNPELSFDYAKKAMTLSKNIQWPIGVIKSYNAMILASYVKSDFINGRLFSEKVLLLEDSCHDINDEITTLETYSSILSKMNLLLEAIKAINKIVTLTDKHYPAYKQFIMYSNLSGLYIQSQQYDIALQKIVKAEEFIPQIKDSLDCLAIINLKKGSLYYYINDSNNAVKYFLKSIYYYDRSLNNSNEVMACTNLATLYLDKKKFDSSILYLNKGYIIAASNHDSYGQNCLLSIKCKYYYANGNYNAAMQCLIKTIPNIESNKDYGTLMLL
jgi:tetratricopeptide (TPR) repeat protein